MSFAKEMDIPKFTVTADSRSVLDDNLGNDNESLKTNLENQADLSGTRVETPMTGVYYASPSPGSPQFVSIGAHVSAGQVVALIEAMKVFNEIVAPIDGTVQKIMAEPGSVVNAGDVLLILS